MDSNAKSIRCTNCSAEFSEAELEGKSACPGCGTTGVPCSIAEDVTVRINWHELRILGIWADNYAREHCDADGQKALSTILRRLQLQYPTKTPLTLMGGLQQVADALGTPVKLMEGGRNSSKVVTINPVPANEDKE